MAISAFVTGNNSLVNNVVFKFVNSENSGLFYDATGQDLGDGSWKMTSLPTPLPAATYNLYAIATLIDASEISSTTTQVIKN